MAQDLIVFYFCFVLFFVFVFGVGGKGGGSYLWILQIAYLDV